MGRATDQRAQLCRVLEPWILGNERAEEQVTQETVPGPPISDGVASVMRPGVEQGHLQVGVKTPRVTEAKERQGLRLDRLLCGTLAMLGGPFPVAWYKGPWHAQEQGMS